MTDFHHVPVMADRIVELFRPVPAGVLVDATLGGGGHARLLLEARPDSRSSGSTGTRTALAAAAAVLAPFGDRVTLRHARFDHLDTVMTDLKAKPVSGVLFDLGVSSPQLDQGERGFSYRHDGPLDMRMDPSRAVGGRPTSSTATPRSSWSGCCRSTATSASPSASPRAIVADRPIETTGELADIVRDAIPAPARRRGGHPAKRTFQAIRIEVNRELEILPGAIDDAIDAHRARRPGRRAVVPLGRGPHREGPVPPRRHRRLHLPARPAVRVRRRADRAPAAAGGVEADRGRGRRPTPGPSRPACAPPRSSPSTSSAGAGDDRRPGSRRPPHRRRRGPAAHHARRTAGSTPASRTEKRRPDLRVVPRPRRRRAGLARRAGRASLVFGVMLGLVAFQAKIAADQLRLDQRRAAD